MSDDIRPNSTDAALPVVADNAQDAAAEGAAAPRVPEESRGRRRERKLVGYSRFMAIVPSVGLFISSMALTISTLISTVMVTFEAACGRLEMQDMLVDYIEFADFFLLAVVLYIMSVGLYSLFVDDGIDMPSWLQIRNLDDLKEKLVGVIVVVMGVYFLGLLIHGTEPIDLLLTGIGIGAVVLTLAYFVRYVMVAHNSHDRDK
ncbi:YqhA family protein [uncultured Slackia sp.]|uniref:YqhA family protein n=1 Tax=uncultured Slackia sp. TaxID=665903 RepID=UPI0026DFDB14|nr:YqhA family protein [uncultured Slackia sp.]